MLTRRATLAAAYAITQDVTLAEVAASLHARTIRPLLIKGPAVARWLYDDPAERPYGDLDLLVHPDQRATAGQVLSDLGFHNARAEMRAAEQHPNEESAWVRTRERAVWVELHHKLFLVGVEPVVAWQLLSRHSMQLTIAGVSIDTPSAAAHLVILALHAAHHGAGEPKPTEDLRRALARVDGETWQAAGALAGELRAGGPMREGLSLVEGGRELADAFGLADDASRFVRLRARGAPTTASGIERLILARGVRSRLALLASKLAPSPAFLREWSPLARRGRPGLMVAYLRRPLWLAWNLPRGFAAWCEAALPHDRRRRIPAFLAGGRWALRAWWRCRRQLRRGGLQAVTLPEPPAERPGARNGVERVLRGVHATCLEASLVRQRWHAAHGRPRDVVIGVQGTRERFRAHAWLDGDPDGVEEFTELKRWAPPQ